MVLSRALKMSVGPLWIRSGISIFSSFTVVENSLLINPALPSLYNKNIDKAILKKFLYTFAEVFEYSFLNINRTNAFSYPANRLIQLNI